jgi:uncharacterized protein YaiI (UPF0178 family)
MTIWIDADSCPAKVRTIIGRASTRTGVPAVFVANREIPLEKEPLLRMEIVAGNEGAADDYLADTASPGDLAVTRDIPLAERLVNKGLCVLNDRGDVYTRDNIRERLSIRNVMLEFRLNGMMDSPERTYGDREVKAFAAAFDRHLSRLVRDLK